MVTQLTLDNEGYIPHLIIGILPTYVMAPLPILTASVFVATSVVRNVPVAIVVPLSVAN